jgi:biopolymer transport protein TolQ
MREIIPIAVMNLFSYFTSIKPFIVAFHQSDTFGKLIMLALIGLSLLCWLIILQKRKEFKTINLIQNKIIEETLKQKNPLGTYEPTDKSHPFSQLYLSFKSKSLDLLNKNKYFLSDPEAAVYLSEADLKMVENYAAIAIDEALKKLERNIMSLSTITTLAPFLGLLGTVWGILMTFSELSSGAQAAQNSAVIGGLSMALATTVMGLVIAIPSLVGFNQLKGQLKNTESDLDNFLAKLMSQLELQYRKVNT